MSEDMNVELPDEDNFIEEELDTKNAEAQSVASVAKADDGVKKAPTRKGDSSKQEPMPKSKAQVINAMVNKASGMKLKDLHAMYGKMMGEEVETDEDSIEETHFDYSEELTQLVESEATLSEEFKAKTAVLFDTAIRNKIAEEVSRLDDEYTTKLSEELDATRTDLVEKVDNYLNYVVETWMKENELAVEQGIRTDIAESFMNNLKNLFIESYITVPESKVDLVDELATEVEELESKLNYTTEQVIGMTEELEGYKRETVIREAARDLAETQIEKLRSLVDTLEFDDEESFATKVKTVKEAYFKKEITAEVEEITEDWSESPTDVNSTMDMYLRAIKKTHKE